MTFPKIFGRNGVIPRLHH